MLFVVVRTPLFAGLVVNLFPNTRPSSVVDLMFIHGRDSLAYENDNFGDCGLQLAPRVDCEWHNAVLRGSCSQIEGCHLGHRWCSGSIYPIWLRTAYGFIFLILHQGTFLYNSKSKICLYYPCKFAWFFSSINIGAIKRLFLTTTNDQLPTETKNW